ncbi:MAG: 16S rRNA (uracil(1498)-N(3))-methyltransferase [bacterium]|jgi:16S rRNA (uracil1498-N3)-methyltransferase
MNRLCLPGATLGSGLSLHLAGEEAHYILRVLRLRKGDGIFIFDGAGNEYEAVLETAERGSAFLRLGRAVKRNTEPLVRISLAQALPRGDKMDLIIQKCTEIGVAEILPFSSARGIPRVKEITQAGRLSRWRRIACEAAEQSQRVFIPEVAEITALDQIAESIGSYDLSLVAWEDSIEPLKTVWGRINRGAHSILLVVGPEGGFTIEEIELLRSYGALDISLGSRILRTETAGMVLAALTVYEMDS